MRRGERVVIVVQQGPSPNDRFRQAVAAEEFGRLLIGERWLAPTRVRWGPPTAAG
jgi:hypothetical protein